MNKINYRIRLRFKLQKKLSINSREHRFNINKYEIVLTADSPNVEICDSEWLVMNIKGLESENEAKVFAEKFKISLEVSSAATRLGIDTGIDLPTSGLGGLVKKYFKEQEGIIVRDNIHGVDIFKDEPNIRFSNLKITGTIRKEADIFITGINNFFGIIGNISQKTRNIILILNYALMRPDPISQIVFAFSAVEMLGQNEKWTDNQKKLINNLADSVKNMEIGNLEEKEEVSEAIKKGLYKLSLRQGVIRLLNSLGLSDLKKTWDDLYKERSTLVHGLAPEPGVDYGSFAHKTVSFCGRILLTAIAREISGANNHIDKYYELD